jgi:DNA-binding PucR family transcriptional regulator
LADNLLQADDLSEVVTVYLDSEILNLLLIDESDEVSKQMQASLVIQTIETVVHGISQSLRDDGQSISELSDEVGAFRFMAQLSSNLKVSMEEIIQFSLSNPAILRAKLESQFKIRTLNEQLLKGGQ